MIEIPGNLAFPNFFVEVNIHVNPELHIQQAHEISHKVEEEISKIIDRCTVHVHTEPEGSSGNTE